MEIVEYDRPRHLLVHVRSNLSEFTSMFDFAARGDVTQLISTIDPKPKGVLRLLAPLLTGMLKAQLKKNWQLVKGTLKSQPR